MERPIIITLVESDNAPDLAVRFLGLVLNSYDSIKMKIKLDDLTRFERDVVPDGSDLELGTVSWQDGDLVRGSHTVEFEFTKGTAVFTVPRACPITLSVRPDIS